MMTDTNRDELKRFLFLIAMGIPFHRENRCTIHRKGKTAMPIADILLAEFESQAPTTRRFLERLPADKLTWKPHDRSMTAGQLAYHLALVPG